MGGRRMLVVDDDRTACTLMRLLFAREGLEVLTAPTLGEGLALLDDPFDFIVLDISLPDGDGREILDRVRRAGLPTRVALASGWGEAVGGGAADVVMSKP